MKPFAPVSVAALLSVAFACSGSSIETNKSVPATHTATRAVLKVKAQLDAVVEASEAEPVKFSPKAWTDLTVVDAVAHGSRVKKGDLLVRLDVDKLRDQIEDLEADRPAAALALELAQAELENLRQTTPNKLEAARRAQRNAADDYAYFEATGRASREKNTKFNVKSAEQRLLSANEELRQLEKMYKADDLTEETEEIVLKRQRFMVEAAEYSLQNAREYLEREFKSSIPREYDSLKAAKRDQDIALAYAELTSAKTLSKKQLDFEKLKRDQQKAERRLNDLRYDLDNLTQRSPIDGIAYYGACENGRWTTGPVVGKKLVPGGKLLPNEIVVTVVNSDKLRLRAVVSEADFGNYSIALKGEASPVAAPSAKLPVKVEELGQVPMPGGGFDAVLSLSRDQAARLMPGMNCKVAFTGIEKRVAIAVPKSAVFSDATSKFVYVLKADGSNEKRTVKTGDSDESLTEISDGLSDGDKVLLKKPEQA